MTNYSVIDAEAHLVQAPDDPDIRSLWKIRTVGRRVPIFQGTGWDPSYHAHIATDLWNTEEQVRAMDQEGIDV